MSNTTPRRYRPMIVGSLALLGGSPAESNLPTIGGPRCEARSTTAPGRLILDTRAEHYGTRPPCQLKISFAIARNSNLRALSVRFVLETNSGDVRHDEIQTIELHGPSGGIWRAELPLSPATVPSCRALALDARILQCVDGQRREIACPQVRVRESLVLHEFNVSGATVCFDD